MPGGIGRKLQTQGYGFYGLSALVNFPDPQDTKLVKCGNGDTAPQDAAWIYSGGAALKNGFPVTMDAGFQLANSGNTAWKSFISDNNGHYVDSNGVAIDSKAPPPFVYLKSGTTTFRLELPGYKRQQGEPALGAPLVIGGVVHDNYVILSCGTSGEMYFYSAVWNHAAGASLKRCNTLAQTVPMANKVGANGTVIKDKNGNPIKVENGNGPGSGFFLTGSQVKGGSWENVKIYDANHLSDSNALNFMSNLVNDFTYPGTPYVGWNVENVVNYANHNVVSGDFYNNENGINLSTLPFANPATDCPNQTPP